jgi:DNA-binding SARP family transcriptional activator
VSQDELIDQLWGDDAPPSARASLQNLVHGLRRRLGASVIGRQPAGYVVHVEPDRLDLARFERLVAAARRSEPKERASKLRDALACRRGPALVEFPREPFLAHELNRLEEERLSALEDRIEADLALARHAELIGELEVLVLRHPLRERLWEQLMLSLYRAGRQADALAAYRRAHEGFVEELGVLPGAALRELNRAMLVQDPALSDSRRQIGSRLERAAAILPGEAHERVQSLYDYAVALLRLDDREQAEVALKAAERAAVESGDLGLAEQARLELSWLACFTEGRSALEHLAATERATRAFEQAGDDVGLARALAHRAHVVREDGHAAEAALIAQRAAELARRAGDRWQEGWCRAEHALSLAYGPLAIEKAIVRCEAAQERAGANELASAAVRSALALLHAQAGRAEEARELGQLAVSRTRESGRSGTSSPR